MNCWFYGKKFGFILFQGVWRGTYFKVVSKIIVLYNYIWAPSSEFVSSSIPSWQILTAHAQPFRGTRDLAFCLKVPLDSLLVWASSGGSGESARMRRLAWTFTARIGDKYQIRMTRSIYQFCMLGVAISLDGRLWTNVGFACLQALSHQSSHIEGGLEVGNAFKLVRLALLLRPNKNTCVFPVSSPEKIG